MAPISLFALILAAVWGAIWALFLQTYPGRFLAARYTWLAVVVGVGVDLLVMLLVVPFDDWLMVAAIIATSSVAIIARSVFNEMRDAQLLTRMNHEHADPPGEQNDLGD